LDEGIEVVFGSDTVDGTMSGAVVRPTGWQEVTRVPVHAVFDRYPRRELPVEHRTALAGLGAVLVCNGGQVSDRCADKLAAQACLTSAGLSMPPIVTDPTTFQETLVHWGVGFLKPQFGTCGYGVKRVVPGDRLPLHVEGAESGPLQPSFLQRAVAPLEGWAAVALRLLVQRDGDDWFVNPGVARRSRTDVVASASRGAEVVPLRDLGSDVMEAAEVQARAAAQALAATPGGEELVEVGVDMVVDASRQPVLIEVNSRPWGRLKALVAIDEQRWGAAHEAACARPFRWLSGLDR
jgi:glutathione synthase/RimK-type ligase-like ATP-grasp enzyme